MKKKFSRIFGLTLALVLALSLVFPVAAVAGTNKWSAETIMSYSSTLLATKTISPNNIAALAGDSGGEALYAIVGSDKDTLAVLETAGTGTAEWSTTPAGLTGAYCAKLICTGTGLTEWSAAKVAYGETLATLVALTATKGSYTVLDVEWNVWATDNPVNYATLWVDEDADGTIDTRLTGGFDVDGADGSVISLAGAGWIEAYKTSAATWQLRDYTAGVVATYTGTNTNAIDSLPGYLADGGANAIVEYVGVSYTNNADPAYVDDITIGGVSYLCPKGTVYKSTNDGQSWGTPATTAPTASVVVAVAPDDPDYVIAADEVGNIYVTVNGGTSWSSTDLTSSFTAVTCVDISVPDSLGKRWIAIGGNLTTAGALMVSKIETFTTPVNATSTWTAFGTSTKVLTVKYSPMLDYDETLLAVTTDGTDTHLQAGSIANTRWNSSTDFGSGWPADIITATSAVAASIALPDTYDGVEPTARVVYIGTNVGVYRMDNTTDKELITANYRSVAYNSTDNMLIIGSGISNAVKMSANPDTASPSFTTPLRYKYPSGINVAAVAWVGSTMVCGTMGAESALSASTNARSWNQLSLIDSDLDNMTDVAVSEDGATIYLASRKGNVASIWRYASSWERIFCVDIDAGIAAGDVLVRLVPGDPDHILIGEVGGDELRVSTNAGDTWKRAKSKVTIVDIAVEDANTVHVLGTTKVSTSTDGGRHFATGKRTLLTTNAHIVVAPNGDVLVAGVYAGVVTAAYSTDNAATFSRTAKSTGIIPETSGTDGIAILIAPDKDYATNSAIFVAFDEDNGGAGDNYIMRWEIGAGGEEWKSRGPSATVLADAYWFTGLGYYGGALYATATNGTLSTNVFSLDPGATSPTWGTPAAAYIPTAIFSCAPQALKFSSGSNKLWAVDVTTTTTVSKLWSFADTVSLVVAVPTLTGPAEGYEGSVDAVLERIDPIRFSWEQVHKDVGYQLQIGTNEAMTLNTEYYYPADIPPGTDNAEYVTVSDGTTIADNEYPLIAGETYYWRVRVNYPVRGAWSEVRSFSIAEAVAAPVEVTVEIPPVEVTVEAPAVTVEAPMVTVPAPVITVEAPAAADITVEVPPAEAPPTPSYIWSIIAIGAVLVIAVIILIIRTRRVA